MTERTLDRLVEFDERSKQYPIRGFAATADLKTKSWYCPAYLDQGREGACVGFAWSHELASVPYMYKGITDYSAKETYFLAQKIDEWEGEDYSGTSVLAGAKVIASQGYMDEYRWAFGIDDLVASLSTVGPAVLGINWYESMFRPRPSGLLEVTPGGGGGHAILARGINLNPRLKGESIGEPVIRLRNSWSKEWGVNGDCFVKVSDMEALLATQGDACVPVKRNRQPK